MHPHVARPGSPLPVETARLVEQAARLVAAGDLRSVAERARTLVADHDSWRRECLNMLASEGLMSETARGLLASDLATRVTEGFPGVKDDTTSPPEANRFIDEIEALLIALARRLFGAEHVEWRPASTTMANAVVLFALTEPGDTILVQSMSAGANISYHADAVAGLRGLRTVEIPGTREFGIDLDGLAAQVRETRPRAIVFGGSKVLFPYPVREIRAIADEVGALVVYDGAHVAPLIAGGCFNAPLEEGAHVLTTGTHKMTGGPVGGLILTNDDAMGALLHRRTYPGFMQTRDQNKYAAAVVALAEMAQYADSYSRQVVANARRLGSGLAELGFTMVGAERGFSASHQVVIDAGADATAMARACARANILATRTNIFGEGRDHPGTSGIRGSVAQLTRQGMREPELATVAELVFAAAHGRRSLAVLQAEVRDLTARFPGTAYSFDDV